MLQCLNKRIIEFAKVDKSNVFEFKICGCPFINARAKLVIIIIFIFFAYNGCSPLCDFVTWFEIGGIKTLTNMILFKQKLA